jgi:hypothetical protein
MKSASLVATVPVLLALSGLVQAQESTGLAQARAACTYPQAPQSFPDGATAPKEDMLAGQATVKEYQKAVEETYLPCLEKEMTDSIAQLDNTDEAYAQKKAALEGIHAKKHNAALDELQAVADRWKDEITEFKGRGKE